MFRIYYYESEYVHARRKTLVDYLLGNLNNIVEESTDGSGMLVGSGMYQDLRNKRHSHIWIAWHHGTPVAWGTLTYRSWDSLLQSGIYVHPNFRRMGLATRILRKMKAYAESQNRGIVSQGWDPKGRKFYRDNGIPYEHCWDFGNNFF